VRLSFISHFWFQVTGVDFLQKLGAQERREYLIAISKIKYIYIYIFAIKNQVIKSHQR
jgi:hypothetical protein